MRLVPLLVVVAACGSESTTQPNDAGGDGAGSSDAAAQLDATQALCDRGGLLFCEDFEALPLGAATSTAWTTESAAGQLTIDATHARGQHALKVSTQGNGRARLQKLGLAPPNNSMWGAMHVWVTAFPTAPDYAHYTLVELAGTGNTSLIRPIGGQYIPAAGAGNPAGAFWGVGSDGGATGDWTNWKRTTPSASGQWLCLEFHLDATNDAIDIYIDGVAKPELSVTRTNHGGNQVDFVFPTFNQIWFGWWLYQLNPTPSTYDVWLDDLALGPARLGCE
ncbi:MAG TPA: hypothetical protein VIV40_20020 [Kofleriaceae bacterium]